jgi:hypothetical protein
MEKAHTTRKATIDIDTDTLALSRKITMNVSSVQNTISATLAVDTSAELGSISLSNTTKERSHGKLLIMLLDSFSDIIVSSVCAT